MPVLIEEHRFSPSIGDLDSEQPQDSVFSDVVREVMISNKKPSIDTSIAFLLISAVLTGITFFVIS